MSQFVTLKEAKLIADQLTVANIGRGVPPYNANEPDKSGIYIPEYNGPFATPEDGERKFYHIRFRNGAEGFNAGLLAQTMRYAPTRWPLMIATEVNDAASGV